MELEPGALHPEPQEAPPPEGMASAAPQGDSILKKTARGAGWIIGWRMATRLLGLVNTLALARILVPADFGLVALATGFAGSLDSLSLLGVEDAIVRLGTKDRDVFDTGFTINAIRGALTAILILIAAEPAAEFFHEPRLTYVLAALALSAFLSGLENIGTVEFVQDMSFDKEFRLLVIPRVISVIATLALGVAFRSYWALVAGMVMSRFFRVGMTYLMHPYRPRLSLRSWQRIAGFSAWTWVLSMLRLVQGRTASFAIGRMLSVGAVAFYEVGLEIAWLPTSELIGPLCRACFPGFVAVRESGRVTAETYLRVIGAMALFTLPAGVGLSSIADPIVKLAFGPGWGQMIPVVEIFAVAGTMTIFGLVSSALFSAHGLLKSMAAIVGTMTALRLIVIVLLVKNWGIVGGVAGAALANMVEQAIYVVLTCRGFGVHASGLFACVWRGVAATIVMAVVLCGTGLGWIAIAGGSATLAIRLFEAVGLGAVVYSLVLVLLWLLSGRPNGGEADLFRLALRTFKGAAAFRRGRRLASA